MVAPEQEAEHDDGGEEIGSEDGPDRDVFEQALGESHDHSDEEYLEAAEEHEDGEQDAALIVDEREETGCRNTESEECQTVNNRVLEHEPGRDHERGRIAQAV